MRRKEEKKEEKIGEGKERRCRVLCGHIVKPENPKRGFENNQARILRAMSLQVDQIEFSSKKKALSPV